MGDHPTVLGLAIDWTAITTLLLFLATAALVGLGMYQLLEIRREARRTRTLAVCERYDSGPVLDRCLRRIRRGKDSGELEANPKRFRTDIGAIVNYLDFIAIGIRQGVYIERIVWDNMEFVIADAVRDYIYSGLAQKAEINPDNHPYLIALRNSWVEAPPR